MGDRNVLQWRQDDLVCKDIIRICWKDAKYIKDIDIQVIQPRWNMTRWTNTIMDIIDFDKGVKRCWRDYHACWSQVYVMLSGGCDGKQCRDLAPLKVIWRISPVGSLTGRYTLEDNDVIISFDVIPLLARMGREGMIRQACICCVISLLVFLEQNWRSLNGKSVAQACFCDVARQAIAILIIKQVAGQACVWSSYVPERAIQFRRGQSIIDMENMPVMITPNEYRDGYPLYA